MDPGPIIHRLTLGTWVLCWNPEADMTHGERHPHKKDLSTTLRNAKQEF